MHFIWAFKWNFLFWSWTKDTIFSQLWWIFEIALLNWRSTLFKRYCLMMTCWLISFSIIYLFSIFYVWSSNEVIIRICCVHLMCYFLLLLITSWSWQTLIRIQIAIMRLFGTSNLCFEICQYVIAIIACYSLLDFVRCSSILWSWKSLDLDALIRSRPQSWFRMWLFWRSYYFIV